jgi:hypothetical protein
VSIITEIDTQIEALETKKRTIQDLCSHPMHQRVAGASTGNYDPSADCYWYDCYCSLCGKRWVEDQ